MRLIFFLFVCFWAGSNALIKDKWCSENSTFKTPAAGTCNGFWLCDNGKIQYSTCSVLQLFDSEKLECVWSLLTSNVPCGKQSVSDDDLWCSPGSIYKVPMNGLCSSYYHCKNGLLNIETCTWPMEFHPYERECQWNVWPYTFDCSNDNKHHTIPTPEPTTPSHINPPGVNCFKGKTFLQADPKDCSQYYSCKDGVLSTEYCTYGRKFDPSTLECRFSLPWNEVNCNSPPKKPTVLPTTPRPTKAPTISPKAPTTSPKAPTTPKPPEIPKSIICKADNYFTARDSKNCWQYYLCSKGKVTIEECSTLYRFDPLTHECKVNVPLAYSVNCSAVPEKPVCKSGYNFKIAASGNSKKYYDCSNGTLKKKECGTLHSFDPKSQGCVLNIFGLNFKAKDAFFNKLKGLNCTGDKTFNISYPGDCHRYYTCANLTFQALECPYGQKYDSKSKSCVVMSQCDLLTCYSEGPLCYPGISYRIPVGDNCNEYSECNDGSWTKASCPAMHQFDPISLECKFSFKYIYSNVNCSAKPKCDNKPLFEELLNKKVMESFQNQDLSLKSTGWPKCAAGQNFKAPNPYDCSKYIGCKNGTTKVVSCSIFHKFDPTILDCRFDSPFNPVVCNKVQGKPKCNKQDHFMAVFPYDCSKYYDCSNGNVTVKSCGYLQKFDPQTLKCRYSVYGSVNCDSLPGQPNCPVGKKFNSIYPGDCSKYYICKNGTVTEKQCPSWDKFDPATLQCRLSIPYIYSVNCSAVPGGGTPNAKVLEPTPKVENKAIVEVTTKAAYPEDVKANCKLGKIWKAVDKSDCKSYYSCSNGELTYEQCGFLKKFNPISLECSTDLPFHRVNCTALPGEPTCPEKGILRKPYPGNCKQYFECNEGKLSIVKCGLMHTFNKNKSECTVSLPFTSDIC